MRKAGPHHRLALIEAVRVVTGIETTTDGISLHGMLDPDILTQIMRKAGLDEPGIQKALPAVIEAAQNVYPEGVPDLRDKRCPGAEEVLIQLQSRGVVLALVTGNLTRIGWHKLERAGLHQYFRFGAFAETAATRGGLAKLAIERARREGLVGAVDSISLIGDAPQDVIAAKENGIRSIAVKTGVTSADELHLLEPDMLIDDLTCLDISII